MQNTSETRETNKYNIPTMIILVCCSIGFLFKMLIFNVQIVLIEQRRMRDWFVLLMYLVVFCFYTDLTCRLARTIV